MNTTLNPLERRIVELSYVHQLSHISSCLNTVNLLNDIYNLRKDDEPVILGNSHAALSLFVVLEAYGHGDAEEMIEVHGVHAGRDMKRGIWVSGGSLGQAETIAVGMAMADREKTVWLVTSDGACAEGSVWEAFNLASNLCLVNLSVTIIANGYGAYGKINLGRLWQRLYETLHPVEFRFEKPVMQFDWLRGLNGHYLTINQQQYEEAMA